MKEIKRKNKKKEDKKGEDEKGEDKKGEDKKEEDENDEDFLGHALCPKLSGGSLLRVEARIQIDSIHLSDLTPMYIREGKGRNLIVLKLLTFVGAIIPKQKPRSHVPDRTTQEEPPDAITLHFYPGKDNVSHKIQSHLWQRLNTSCCAVLLDVSR